MKQAYINGIILDGTKDMKPVSGKMILCNDGIIESIENQRDISDYEIIDLKNRYIMPGLINLHVHLPATGKPQKKPTDPKKLIKLVGLNSLTKKIGEKICEKSAKTQLLSGTTTIRTVGGAFDYDTIIRDKIANKEIIGPRILASNMAISVPEGHMAGSLAYIAHDENETSNYVEMIAKDKPDLIKLMITGGVLDAKVKGEPGELKMSAELVKAACDKAHELGLVVASHVESPEGVKVALKNGVDTIEHGAKPDEEMISLFKERNASLVTTLSPALPFALFDQSVSNTSDIEKYNGNIVFEGIIDCAKTCLKEGIKVGLGTDTGCPYVTHYNMWRELNYFHNYCDVSNSFALYTATLVNAEIAKISHMVGSIENGKCADFIVTKENPLDNLCALRNIDMVVKDGKIINNPTVKKMDNVERELDKFI